MSERVCRVCGKPLERRPTEAGVEFDRREHCSRICANKTAHVNANADFWTAERVDELRRLVAEGSLTYAKIAAKWGVTKNVVLSKANRLGLCKSAPLERLPGKIGTDPGSIGTAKGQTFPPPGRCLFAVRGVSPPYVWCGKPVTKIERDGELIPGAYCAEHYDRCVLKPSKGSEALRKHWQSLSPEERAARTARARRAPLRE